MDAVFIGSGAICARHKQNWRTLFPYAKITVVSRSKPSTLEEGESHCASFPEALKTRPICVFVCNPSIFHVEYAAAAMQAGAHVFCEKPLAHNSSELDSLLSLAREKERVLFVGYNLRYHGCIAAIKEALDGKAIGAPLSYFLEVGQHLEDWRPNLDYRESVSAQRKLGGGALLELSHELDMALYLGGKAVRDISGCFGKASDLQIDVEDFANIRVLFEDHLSVFIHADFMQRPGHRRYRLLGTKGSIDWDSGAAEVLLTDYENGREIRRHLPNSADPNHAYMRQLQAFLAQLEAGPCVSSATEKAVEVVKMIDSIKNSQ